MAKTLYLEKMGRDFSTYETAESDIKNYRVETRFDRIRGKDGNYYFLSFTLWKNRTHARNTHKVTGKPLKHTHYDIINKQALGIDTQYDDGKESRRNLKLENEIYSYNFSFNRADILKVINMISSDNYTNIILFDNLHCKFVLDTLNYSILGYRELKILSNLSSVEQIRKANTYLKFRFTDICGDYFEYEANSKRITE